MIQNQGKGDLWEFTVNVDSVMIKSPPASTWWSVPSCRVSDSSFIPWEQRGRVEVIDWTEMFPTG